MLGQIECYEGDDGEYYKEKVVIEHSLTTCPSKLIHGNGGKQSVHDGCGGEVRGGGSK